MVEILEKVKIVTKDQIIHVQNYLGEKYIEHVSDNCMILESGKCYGIIGESGSGGEVIASILSGNIYLKEQKIYVDSMKLDKKNIQKYGWYVGKKEYSKGIMKHEISVKKALNSAIMKYHKFDTLEEAMEMFHLKKELIEYKIYQYGWEKLRASLAIGYANNKKIFCFPWMNSHFFYYSMTSSLVYRFFNKLKAEGCIIVLFTSKEENVKGLVDETIQINNPHFNYTVADNLETGQNYPDKTSCSITYDDIAQCTAGIFKSGKRRQ